MNWKNRLTNYNFWISIISAILLILQAFNIEFDIAYINEIATAVLGLLVVIGIISDPTKTAIKQDVAEKIKEEQKVEEKVEELAEEKTVESEDDKQVEDTAIPNVEEDAIVVDNNKNDYENIVETISADLKSNENIKELKNILLNLLNMDKAEEEAQVNEQKIQFEEVKNEEEKVEKFIEDIQENDTKKEEISSFNIVN